MHWQISLIQLALAQGVLAATFSWLRKLDVWWILIQLLFPLALVLVIALQLPSWIFLFAFVFTLLLYWSTFRTQVPFYPSGPDVWHAVADCLPAHPARVVDIGSGLGGLSLSLAATRPDCHIVGVELAPMPWLVSWLRARFVDAASGRRPEFLLMDYEQLNFADFDLVFAYLSPTAMTPLWSKAKAEMRPGAVLLSYEFIIPDMVPDMQKMINSRQVMLYGWRF
ncbi:MAG: methyltransferase domain-containing protein [Burkholderiales bacterium]|nr:methyltransferase domain-containing protein [Burkholderiales bacterium]